MLMRSSTVAFALSFLAACGAQRAEPAHQPAPSTTSSIDPAALEGCRAPTQEGCAACCTALPDGRCQRSTGETDWYNGVELLESACPAACSPCARCTAREESGLRELGERADCDCSVAPGIDPCFAPGSCGCWCERRARLLDACPPG